MKVIKIGAVWCPTCLVMKPRWQEIEKENPWLQTEYFDFDDNKKDVLSYNADKGKLPIFIFQDKQGKELFRLTGEIGKEKLIELISKNKNK